MSTETSRSAIRVTLPVPFCLLLLIAALGGAHSTAQPARIWNSGLEVEIAATFEKGRGAVGEGLVAFGVPEEELDLNGNGSLGDLVVHLVDFQTGAITNLGLAILPSREDKAKLVNRPRIVGDHVLFAVPEVYQDDRNGDGDLFDVVPVLYNHRTGQTTNLGLPIEYFTLGFPPVQDPRMALTSRAVLWAVDEGSHGADLDGDGLVQSRFVVHLRDLVSGKTRVLGNTTEFWSLAAVGEMLLVLLVEKDRDLNSDGDLDDSVLHRIDPISGTVLNIGAATEWIRAWDQLAVFFVNEASHNRDLNGDGDLSDRILGVFDSSTMESRILGLAVHQSPGSFSDAHGSHLAFSAAESRQQQDLNGDGDQLDEVLHVYDAASRTVTNLGYATPPPLFISNPFVSDTMVGFSVHEASQGNNDLNGDGDTEDWVVHVHDFETGITRNLFGNQLLSVGDHLVSFGIEESLQVFDRRSGSQAGPGHNYIGGTLHKEPLVYFETREGHQGVDLNGDGDAIDNVLQVFDADRLTVQNLGLATVASYRWGFTGLAEDPIFSSWDDTLVCQVREKFHGSDLNGDGDDYDTVIHFVQCCPYPRAGTVNAGRGSVEDVLFLNQSAGEGLSREVRYRVLEPFRLEMRAPSALEAGENAPFALYAWTVLPPIGSSHQLPLGLGASSLPMPLSGGSPQPVQIWNNAGRTRLLGSPTQPSLPAPSLILDRNQTGFAVDFFLQGVIYDPGSSAPVAASVTNGIVATPRF